MQDTRKNAREARLSPNLPDRDSGEMTNVKCGNLLRIQNNWCVLIQKVGLTSRLDVRSHSKQ